MNQKDEMIIRKSSRLIRTPTSDITFIVHPTEPIVMLGRNGESHTKLMRKMNPTATFRDITTAFHGKMVGERLLLQQEQSHLLRMAPERVAGVLTALQNHLSEHQVRNPRVIAFKDAIKGGKQLDINIQLGTIAELITHSEHRMHKRVKV